jgi:NADH dehydrogenase FAD-containing subunit
VELAGEIATDYPDKHVVLVHSRPKLLDDSLKDKFRDTLKAKLEKAKVEVILNERVSLPAPRPAPTSNEEFQAYNPFEKRTLTTDTGREIQSDAQFLTIGNKVNSAFLRTLPAPAGAVGTSLTDEQGRIRVTDTLQAIGHPNIFVVGDANALPGLKMAYRAKLEADVATKNILALLKAAKGAQPKLTVFKPGPTMMAVTLGRNGGSLQTPLGVLGDWVTKKLKSADLLVSHTWSDFGFKVAGDPLS